MSRAGALRVLLSELAGVGLDAAAVCAAAGLDPRTPSDHALALDLAQLGTALATAQAMSGDALLGVPMAERTPARGVLSYLARSQRTVGDGLEAFARYAAHAWEVEAPLRLERRAAHACVVFDLSPGLSRHVIEYLVVRTVLSLRRSRAVPREVRWSHAPGGPIAEYERVLRCAVRFRQRQCAVVLLDADLQRPLRTANADAATMLAAALSAPPQRRQASTSGRLAAAVEDALARGAPIEREQLGRALGMSGKTLARRLAAEDRLFRQVVDDVRRGLAERWVSQRALDLGAVAARVGFADAAAFGKAFRRWFGVSPSAFRGRRSTG